MWKRIQMVWTGRYLRIMVVLDHNWTIVEYNKDEFEEGLMGQTGGWLSLPCCKVSLIHGVRTLGRGVCLGAES